VPAPGTLIRGAGSIAPPMHSEPTSDAGHFHTTRWSLVAAAGDSERAREALGELAQAYSFPLYAFARRLGVPAHDAEDAVQGFFARLLATNDLARVVEGHGRFRSFLRVALRNHVANLRARERAEKRGGGRVRLGIDLADAEERFVADRVDPGAPPEEVFERDWALAVLARAMARLESEYRGSGRGVVFDALRGHLQGEIDPAQAAGQLGLEPGAVRVAAHRLRQRLRAALEAEIADTVDGAERVSAELDDLFRALSARDSGRGL
jgi:RNA polymerase sigma-70 factor (ECF subfamily)